MKPFGMVVVFVVAALVVASCAKAPGFGDDDDGNTGNRDAGDGDGDGDAGGDAMADAMSGLDPDLELPDPSGMTCTTPGSLGECPSAEVCRFFDAQNGRCESCTTCGNLGDACAASAECDILFMCFQGSCTNFCTLGLNECGPVENCIDIGHPDRGVCRP